MVMQNDKTWGGEHKIKYRDEVSELYTWNLDNFINQWHPDTFNQNKNIN